MPSFDVILLLEAFLLYVHFKIENNENEHSNRPNQDFKWYLKDLMTSPIFTDDQDFTDFACNSALGWKGFFTHPPFLSCCFAAALI